VNDSECGTGGLCLPDGTCAAPTNIIHAASMAGMNVSGCGVPGGPGACTLKRALTEVTGTKNVIKLDDNGPYNPGMANFVVNSDVTIDARGIAPGGAVLQPTKNDTPILMINSNLVTIFGGTIRGATNVMNNDGIFCGQNATLIADGIIIDTIDKSAINASSGCKLALTHVNINNTSIKGSPFLPAILTAGASITLSRSVFFSNKGGGIKVTNGTFVIVGNSFAANGDVGSSVGGVSINTTTSDPMNRIEFNTISSNATMSGKAPGVDCTVGTGSSTIAIARNNIIWDNNGNMEPQVAGTCKHAYSDIGILTFGGESDGGNNLSEPPMFIEAIYNLHLQSTSPMIGRADPNAKLDGVAAQDFDGNARIKPADIGYDQLPRP